MKHLMSKKGSDDFQTPPEAVPPLSPYLPLDWTIWECACGKGYLAEALRQAGRKVIATDIKNGLDFLKWQPSDWHCAVTNPPFSLKFEFLERAYALGKPFAFLLPLTALESQPRQGLFRDNGIQIMLLDQRIHFETPHQQRSQPWFAVAWFCWKLNLPEQLTFASVSRKGCNGSKRPGDDPLVQAREVVIEGSPEPELLPMRMTPLIRALLEGIPTFAALKTDGVTVEEITAAFNGWDSAVDKAVVATTLKRLVADPVIEIVSPGTDSRPRTHTGRFRLGASGAADEGRLPGERRTSEEASTLGLSNDSTLQEMLTFREVAKLLGCSYGEARNRMLAGRIRAVKDGRWCRSRREWVEEYIEKQAVMPEPPREEVSVQVPKRKTAVNVKANGVAHRFLQRRAGTSRERPLPGSPSWPWPSRSAHTSPGCSRGDRRCSETAAPWGTSCTAS
jgi:excisionase family DNA binding protein